MGCSIPVLTLIHIKNDGQQGFRQFSTVADMFLKQRTRNFFGAAGHLVSAEGASLGAWPQEIIKINTQKRSFQLCCGSFLKYTKGVKRRNLATSSSTHGGSPPR